MNTSRHVRCCEVYCQSTFLRKLLEDVLQQNKLVSHGKGRQIQEQILRSGEEGSSQRGHCAPDLEGNWSGQSWGTECSRWHTSEGESKKSTVSVFAQRGRVGPLPADTWLRLARPTPCI